MFLLNITKPDVNKPKGAATDLKDYKIQKSVTAVVGSWSKVNDLVFTLSDYELSLLLHFEYQILLCIKLNSCNTIP